MILGKKIGVVPEYQCAVKREAKKAQKEKDRPNPTSIGSPEMKEAEVKVIHQLNVIQHPYLPNNSLVDS